MKIYNFALTVSPTCLEKLLNIIDNYLNLGGKRTVVVASSWRYDIALTEQSHISTCEKILKILSFIFFPIVLIALALHYFLHTYYEKTHKIFYLDSNVSEKDKAFLITHPHLVLEAVKNVPHTFFILPSLYRKVSLTYPPNIQKEVSLTYPPITQKEAKLVLTIDLKKISELLDVSKIDIPTSKLREEMACEPYMKAILDQLISEEKERYISENGKRQLLNATLEYLYISGVHKKSAGPTIKDEFWETFFYFFSKGKRTPNTVWYKLLLEHFEDKESRGFLKAVLRQLSANNLLYSRRGFVNPEEKFKGIRVKWGMPDSLKKALKKKYAHEKIEE
ncbi:DUF648 domain-containing protein [Chlamydia sp. 17-3921]|uniref:DUF648 domain-containing protein n=1 Tax=Chlamydia sp. 17-3921 TaxID=2675798 RepID=UPI001917A951|nr:DUF648 domain-containing protein [Chlamydia sp. 17-3921]